MNPQFPNSVYYSTLPDLNSFFCSAGKLQEDGEAGWWRPQTLQRPDQLLPGTCQDREGLFPATEWLGQKMEGCCGERWSGLWDLVRGHRGSPGSLKITCYPNRPLLADTTALFYLLITRFSYQACRCITPSLLNMAESIFYSVRNFINMIMWHLWLCLTCAVQNG